MRSDGKARLFLIGAPRLENASGQRVPIKSKKALALLATIATTERMERTRSWLQQTLWGSRSQRQAQSSLRRELSNLNAVLRAAGLGFLGTDFRTISIDPDQLWVDAREPGQALHAFLEGIDIPGEEGFEEWLRSVRAQTADTLIRPRPEIWDVPPVDSAIVPAQPSLSPHLVLYPTEVTQDASGLTRLARRIDFQLADLLARVKWLPSVNVSLNEAGSGGTANEPGTESTARFGLRIEILDLEGVLSIRFAFEELPGKIVRWSETHRIKGGCSDEDVRLELARVVSCVGNTFDKCVQRVIAASPAEPGMDIAEAALRIRFLIDQLSPSSIAEAETILNHAYTANPYDAEILMLRAHLVLWQHWLRRAGPSETIKLAPLVRAAMRADPSDSRGPLFLGILETWHRRTREALQQLERASVLEPSSALAFGYRGTALVLGGDAEAAIPFLQRAEVLAAIDHRRFLITGQQGIALWMLGRYEEALAKARDIQATNPEYVLAHILEAACNESLGRPDDAAAARARLTDGKAHLADQMLGWIPFTDPSWSKRLRDGAFGREGAASRSAQTEQRA